MSGILLEDMDKILLSIRQTCGKGVSCLSLSVPVEYRCGECKSLEDSPGPSKEYEYYFDVGNSNSGPIGMSAAVRSTSGAKALEALRGSIDGLNSVVKVHSGCCGGR